MRTTLDIDEDVLAAARSVAHAQGKSLGAVVSEFARAAIVGGAAHEALGQASETELDAKLRQLGLVPFPRREGVMVSNETVNALRNEEGV